MILYQYLAIHASFVLFVVVKIVCKLFDKYKLPMHDKSFRSVTENTEYKEEIVKWVPKKKHEVLKAKYKCLKKLFQIYDASVIGLLPETAVQDPQPEEPIRRHKRTYRNILDTSAGTVPISSVNLTQSENGATIAKAVIKDLKLQISTSNLQGTKTGTKDDCTQDSIDNIAYINERNHDIRQLNVQRIQRRKPTRFQYFIHRLLGINSESSNLQPDGRVYASSDNNIYGTREKRQRRGLQVRRVKNVKKVHSEIVIGNDQSLMIFSHIQSIQKSCLLDTTQRQCPILGCHMIVYGIINYNDHLNLCHFPEKKFICHYCHEGFLTERDKNVHENEHIGITQLCNRPANPSDMRVEPTKVIHVNDIQTETDISKIDVPEEKLQKLVSFFERIQDPDQFIAEIKKSRISQSNVLNDKKEEPVKLESLKESRCSINVKQKSRNNILTSPRSDITSKTNYCETFRCRMCGETFDYRRQLALHTSLEHRIQPKFPKFHSCAGIISSSDKTPQSLSTKESCLGSRDLSSEASTNIVYFTSTETVGRKPSVVNNFVQKVRTGFCYKWEPGTKIIRI